MLNNHWHLKFYISHVVVACVVAAFRLDVVRVAGVFLIYTLMECKAMLWLMWHHYSPPSISGALPTAWIVPVSWMLAFGIPGAALLLLLGRWRHFQRGSGPIPMKFMLLYCALVVATNRFVLR
jgi:hypothetical protein